MKYLEKRLTALTAWRFSLLLIFGLNLLLRFAFILYGYISHDEGIAFYNTKLAYSGLVPFIDYNGWNSLVNDYIFGIPRLFLNPTFFSQRLYALIISIVVFWLSIGITRWFSSRLLSVLTALFLTVGSLTYTYFSNTPYSEQLMTLFIILSLYFFTKTLSNKTKFLYDYLTVTSLIGATFIRIQTLPLVFLFFFYFSWKKRMINGYILKLSISLLITGVVLYGPYFAMSIEHTLYALFWPFISNKILIYVFDTPIMNFTQLTIFIIQMFRDYGLLLGFIMAGSFTFLFWKKMLTSSKLHFIGLSLFIIAEFFLVAIIHRPMDATYIYPAVPIMAIVSAFFLDTALKTIPTYPRIFFILMLAIITIGYLVSFPHYKFIKTSLKTADQTPYALLAQITEYVKTQTNPDDEVVSFYLPVIAQLNLRVPLYLNEGPGSLSIADETTAEKFHLTTLSSFRDYLSLRKAKLLVFPSSAIHFFGKDEAERNRTQTIIEKNYILVKEFTDLPLIDGSKSTLLIFRLPD